MTAYLACTEKETEVMVHMVLRASERFGIRVYISCVWRCELCARNAATFAFSFGAYIFDVMPLHFDRARKGGRWKMAYQISRGEDLEAVYAISAVFTTYVNIIPPSITIVCPATISSQQDTSSSSNTKHLLM
jgi:hypothetical protein